MSDPAPVSTIVFDVNETLLDITTLEPLFERLFGDAAMLRAWFAELVLYSQAVTLSGKYTPFGELAGGVLRMVGENNSVAVTDADISELKSLIVSMPAYADVKPALDRLRAAGFQLVTLTNSAPSPSPTPLEKAGIAELFDTHFSVADVEKFKPHPDTYDMVAKAMGVEPSGLCMVACHVWDTIGAQSAGWQGALVTRPNNNALHAPNVPTPDFINDDLAALAGQIIDANTAVGKG